VSTFRVVQVVLVVAVVLGVGGYYLVLDGDGDPPGLTAPPIETRVDVDTPELRATKSSLGIEDCPEPTPGSASGLPDVTLSCFGGGREVNLSSIEGPAVVNLWASWCGPCREELPILARLHQAAGDRLTIMGVDYQDPDPEGALDLLGRYDVTYPQLADPGGSLADELRIRGMPGTMYVDAGGEATFVNLPFDSYEELAGLVRDHTGVDVTAR
jgi:cytochrome c biogenesis protein CcmG, thiol:disulfide interchange protein DsbE